MSGPIITDFSNLTTLYKNGTLKAATAHTTTLNTLSYPRGSPAITPSRALNDRICLVREDITKLRVDAIVNAANSSLLGGGGIDGAIHRAAGPDLVEECSTLGGCETGEAKITDAYELPCRKVIHAVGPVYKSSKSQQCEEKLTSCYENILRLAVQNGLRTIALCGISTGVYGYPPAAAAPVALSTVRKFMLEHEGSFDKVVFVTWVEQDVSSYVGAIPLYFPPVEESDDGETSTTNKTTQ